MAIVPAPPAGWDWAAPQPAKQYVRRPPQTLNSELWRGRVEEEARAKL